MGFGLLSEEEVHCFEVLGTPTRTLPVQYLGLPQSGARLPTTDWRPVIEKVERYLEGWQAKMLSFFYFPFFFLGVVDVVMINAFCDPYPLLISF